MSDYDEYRQLLIMRLVCGLVMLQMLKDIEGLEQRADRIYKKFFGGDDPRT